MRLNIYKKAWESHLIECYKMPDKTGETDPETVKLKDKMLQVINKIMPCNCDEAYISRGLSSPDCPNCNYAEDIAYYAAHAISHISKEGNI